jgi:hypothetical protein
MGAHHLRSAFIKEAAPCDYLASLATEALEKFGELV